MLTVSLGWAANAVHPFTKRLPQNSHRLYNDRVSQRSVIERAEPRACECSRVYSLIESFKEVRCSTKIFTP